MAYPVIIYRISNRLRDYEAMHLEAVRAAIAHGQEALKNSRAIDTFAGRKTQEPFPKMEEPEEWKIPAHLLF
jgi:hypothetical protein